MAKSSKLISLIPQTRHMVRQRLTTAIEITAKKSFKPYAVMCADFPTWTSEGMWRRNQKDEFECRSSMSMSSNKSFPPKPFLFEPIKISQTNAQFVYKSSKFCFQKAKKPYIMIRNHHVFANVSLFDYGPINKKVLINKCDSNMNVNWWLKFGVFCHWNSMIE